MSKTFECPHCQQSLEATEDIYGITINCPNCDQTIKVPDFLAAVVSPLLSQPEKKQVVLKKTQVIRTKNKQCPYCSEMVLVAAKKCKHCGEFLEKKKVPRNCVKCPNCGEIVKPVGKPGNLSECILAIILLCTFVLPGIIYIIWTSTNRRCPLCHITV